MPRSPRGRRRPGYRGPAGCGTDPACSERALGWARRQRPGRRAGGGFKTTQLKQRKHLGLYRGEGGAFLKNLRRTTQPLSKTKTKSLTTDLFVAKDRKIPQTLLPWCLHEKSSRLAKPGAWTPLHHPSALALSPGRPLPTLRSRVGASLCHSAGARCPVPGAGGKRGGAEAPA